MVPGKNRFAIQKLSQKFKGRNYQSYEFIQKNAGKVRVAGAPLAARLDRRASDHTIVILKGLKVP